MARTITHTAPLRRVLQQQLKLSRQLIHLAEQQTDALIISDVARVAALDAEICACVAEQETFEASRVKLCRELAWNLGLDRVPVLTEMLPALPPQEQTALRQLRDELLMAHEELGILKARNLQLLENALHYVQFGLDVLTQAVLQPARYGTNLTHIAAPAFYIDSKA